MPLAGLILFVSFGFQSVCGGFCCWGEDGKKRNRVRTHTHTHTHTHTRDGSYVAEGLVDS